MDGRRGFLMADVVDIALTVLPGLLATEGVGAAKAAPPCTSLGLLASSLPWGFQDADRFSGWRARPVIAHWYQGRIVGFDPTYMGAAVSAEAYRR
jgi:hypothetical protein